MKRGARYLFFFLIFLLFSIWWFTDSHPENKDFSERVKVSLRSVGNQLLLKNQDSTSLILPILELEKSKYKITFQKELSITPDSLISIIKSSIQKSALPNFYRVEVKQCIEKEVAYSFEIKNTEETSIVPCRGRLLPQNCYVIELQFTTEKTSFFKTKTFLISVFLLVLFLAVSFFYKSKPINNITTTNKQFTRIGSFQFYPVQHKLIQKSKEISLSKKECELLEIFVAKPNQLIKRDELTKRVWEDHGIIVGRSLDTYVSKLRKKLKGDQSIKITNVHGVGYKLEIESI